MTSRLSKIYPFSDFQDFAKSSKTGTGARYITAKLKKANGKQLIELS